MQLILICIDGTWRQHTLPANQRRNHSETHGHGKRAGNNREIVAEWLQAKSQRSYPDNYSRQKSTAPTMPYRAVFFDFGGVFTASPFRAVERYADDNGIDSQQLNHTVFGHYHHCDDERHPWHCLERGEITLEAARQQIMARGTAQGFDADIYTIFATLGASSVRQRIVDYALTLRTAGYTVVCITNNVREFGQGWRQLIPCDEIFDHIVDSCEEGVRKPDAEIFQRALRRAGIAAEETLFLDDFPANIDAAAAAGIDGILVGEDDDKTLRELSAALK